MADAGPKLLRGLLEVFILESLEQSPKHGYALLKEMTETFGQEPNRNRLYPLLGRLVRDGYVREVSESGGNRTLYALTDNGRDALHAYRRLPSAFRHALRRIWSVEVHPGQARSIPVASEDEDAEDAAEDDDADADEAEPALRADPGDDPRTMRLVPPTPRAPAAQAPAPPRPAPIDGALPYPCDDARVLLEKNPRTGDLSMRLTGCPMGTYDYCPQCPIFQSVAGLRRLAFPE